MKLFCDAKEIKLTMILLGFVAVATVLPAQAAIDRIPLTPAPMPTAMSARARGRAIPSLREEPQDIRVAPFVTTAWTQTDKYGSMPWDPEALCYNYYTPKNFCSGCSATAGAQLMRYHRWPEAAVEPRTFSCKVQDGEKWQSLRLNQLGGLYAWDLMPDKTGYRFEATGEQCEAIGRLVYDVAVSLGTEFGERASSAPVYTLVNRLPSVFGYADAVGVTFSTKMYNYGYTTKRLEAAVLPNLEAGLPVLLGLNDDFGYGHVALVDGYGYTDGRLLLHVNLGWGGYNDGWYEPPLIEEYTEINTIVYNVRPTGAKGESFACGRIVDAKGVPQANVGVVVTHVGVPVTNLVTSATGSFVMSLPPGVYHVRAEAGTDLVAESSLHLTDCVSPEYRDDGYYTDRIVPHIGNVSLGDLVLTKAVGPEEVGPFVNEYFRASLEDLGIPVGEGKWTYKAVGFPKGLTLDTKNLAVEGVPTEAIDGTNVFAAVTVTRPDKSVETIVLPLTFKVRTPHVLKPLTLGEPCEFDLTETYEEITADWTVSGLPSGLKYDRKTYLVTGKPTKAGRFVVTIKTGKVNGTKYVNAYSAELTVWPSDDCSERVGTAYEEIREDLSSLGAVTAVAGLPTGLKYDKTAGVVTGKPTKAGTFEVTATMADKSKTSFLWTVTAPAAPTLMLNDLTGAPLATNTLIVVQGAALNEPIVVTAGAKVTASGLPTGLKVVVDKTTGATLLSGVPTKAGASVATLKAVLNGVTTTLTRVIEVVDNPFAGTFVGAVYSCPREGAAVRLATMDLTIAPAGGVKVAYVEGKTKFSLSAKSLAYDVETGLATVGGLVLKANAADKKLGFADRTVVLTISPTAVEIQMDDAFKADFGELRNGMLYPVVKTWATPVPGVLTAVTEQGVVSLAYDAKKAQLTFSGKLCDGTAVKGSAPLCAVEGDLESAPILVVTKAGICYRLAAVAPYEPREDKSVVGFDLSVEYEEDGQAASDWAEAVAYAEGDVKFAALMPAAGELVFGAGEEAFPFEVGLDKKGLPIGVAVYDIDAQPGEKPIATVTAKMGKATGGVSFAFTSKKGDKAKYAVDLVWQGEALGFGGQVIRTTKTTTARSGVRVEGAAVE